jgi:hypothetical protein
MFPPPFHRPHKILGAAFAAANLLASCNSTRRLTDQHHTIWTETRRRPDLSYWPHSNRVEMRQPRQPERCFSATSHGNRLESILLIRKAFEAPPTHGSLRGLRVPHLREWARPWHTVRYQPVVASQTHTVCTPPSNVLTVSADTFRALVCSFDNSTNSGRVAAGSVPGRRRGISWSASRNRNTWGRLIWATGKSPWSLVKRSTAYLNSRTVLAGERGACRTRRLLCTDDLRSIHPCLAGRSPRSLSHRWRRLR